MALVTRPATGRPGLDATPDRPEDPAHAGLAALRLPGLVPLVVGHRVLDVLGLPMLSLALR